MIARLRRGVFHTGEVSFGSGFQQGAAIVIDAFGVDAGLAIGSACGISWDGHRLRGGGRWMDSLEERCGLRVRRLHADCWPAAEEIEQEILAAGLPLIAGIDSFGIPSPHQRLIHLLRAVIVLEASAGGVTVCDPMNEPGPTHLDRARYARLRAREDECREGLLSMLGAEVCGGVSGEASAQHPVLSSLGRQPLP